ncbi:MAG: hypothetical protein M3P32_06300, partial [Chloroflexota bacterium]|nr:hypothetical protein [Chloroflexota bacterium]
SDQTTGAPRVWLGRVSGGELSWQRMPGAASFAGTVVTALVSTGDQAIAFGWDRTTEAPLTWTTTGSGWVRWELPAAFGGIPQVAAAGGAGVVVVGHALSAPDEDPVVWHRAPNGSWQPERDPVIAQLPEASAADCAPLPRDALAFVLLDRATAAFCYGDAPITFRAWSSPPCQDCEGGGGGGTFEPEWLAAPDTNRLRLGLSRLAIVLVAVLPPTVATSTPAAWVETWLEVTGHFDDPASETCQYTPPPNEPTYYSGGPWVVNGCRQQFVVSSVRVVDGP